MLGKVFIDEQGELQPNSEHRVLAVQPNNENRELAVQYREDRRPQITTLMAVCRSITSQLSPVQCCVGRLRFANSNSCIL